MVVPDACRLCNVQQRKKHSEGVFFWGKSVVVFMLRPLQLLAAEALHTYTFTLKIEISAHHSHTMGRFTLFTTLTELQ